MKLGTLNAAQEGISIAYRLQLHDGLRAIKLRRELKRLTGELDNFVTLRNDIIKATGKDAIGTEDPEYGDVCRLLNEAAEEEIADPAPLIEDGDFSGKAMCAADLDLLYVLGLMAEPKDAAPAEPKEKRRQRK